MKLFKIFEKRKLHIEFTYNNKIIVITNDMPKYYFTIEDTEDEQGVAMVYTSAKKLLSNSRIEGKSITI